MIFNLLNMQRYLHLYIDIVYNTNSVKFFMSLFPIMGNIMVIYGKVVSSLTNQDFQVIIFKPQWDLAGLLKIYTF